MLIDKYKVNCVLEGLLKSHTEENDNMSDVDCQTMPLLTWFTILA